MRRKTTVGMTGAVTAAVASFIACGAAAPASAAEAPGLAVGVTAPATALTGAPKMPTSFPGSDRMPAAQIGQPYEHRVSYGGKADTIVAENLPAGLSMDATGLISGRPTVAVPGTHTFTLAAFDLHKLAWWKESVAIQVNPIIEGTPPTTIEYGTTYEHRFTMLVPGTTVRVGSGELPPGLTLTPEGLLSGELKNGEAKTYTFGVVAENEYIATAPREYAITVPVVQNYKDHGFSGSMWGWEFSGGQTHAWFTYSCPERTPYLINERFAPDNAIFPNGAQLIQLEEAPIWYSALATERDDKKSGVKDLHTYNRKSYRTNATLVLHCTNDRNAAAPY